MTLVEIVTYMPCFYAFIRMMSSHDAQPERERLYKFYMYFGVIFGLTAYLGVYLYVYFDLWRVLRFICTKFGDPLY